MSRTRTIEIEDVSALSEPALAKDWLRIEEDAAWAHLSLQELKSPPAETKAK